MAAIVLVSAIVFVGWHWWSRPRWHFPVESLSLSASVPQFSPGGLIPEDCVSVAFEVGQRTWRPVDRVIVDSRIKEAVTACAFVGTTTGTVYRLRPAGLDSWEIVAEEPWAGDARTHVLHSTHHAQQSVQRIGSAVTTAAYAAEAPALPIADL